MEEKTIMEIFEEIKRNDIPYIPEEGRDAFMTAISFFILAS